MTDLTATMGIPNAYPSDISAPRPITAAGVSVTAEGVTARITDIRAGTDGVYLLYVLTTRRPDIRRVAVNGGTIYPRDPTAIQIDLVVTTTEQPETRIAAHTQTTWAGTDETGLYTSETQLWIEWPSSDSQPSATNEVIISAAAPDLPHVVLPIAQQLIEDASQETADDAMSTGDDIEDLVDSAAKLRPST